MFGTIRKHQTWLWLVIATITIISMVAYLGPAGRASRGTQRTAGDLGRLDGQAITAAEYSNARREIWLQYFFTSGFKQWPEHDSTAITFEAYKRLFLISQMKQLGVEPGDKAVAEFAARITGPVSLDDFVAKYLKPEGLDGDDFERFLRHELGIEQLKDTAGLSGEMVTPAEAEALYRANHKELSTALVYFAASNHLAAVTVTPEALAQYYTNQMNLRYHLRDRVQVDYVEFVVTNYLTAAAAGLTNLDDTVNSIFSKYGTNAFPGVTNETEIKKKIREAFLQPRAALEARRAAIAFAETLSQLPTHPEELAKLAATNKLAVHSLAPFDAEGPKDTDLPSAFIQTAFHLTTNEPFYGPVTNSEAAFVLALKRRLPSEIEPFEQIKARVTADYRNAQAVQLAEEAADKFHTLLVKDLAQSNRFDVICSRAGVKPETVPPFSLSSTNLPGQFEDRIGLRLLQRVAFGTPVGSASQQISMPDGAFVLYVQNQIPVDEAKVKAEAPQFLAYLRQTRQNESFNQWFSQRISQDPEFAQKMQEYYNKLLAENAGLRRSP